MSTHDPVSSNVDYIQESRSENSWQIKVLKWLLRQQLHYWFLPNLQKIKLVLTKGVKLSAQAIESYFTFINFLMQYILLLMKPADQSQYKGKSA